MRRKNLLVPLGKTRAGFTIVELLIVIVVIGILAAVALSAFGNSQAKARDARRLSDARNIVGAIKRYQAEKGYFPALDVGQPGWDLSTDSAGTFIQPLSDDGYMKDVPLDPVNASGKIYRYFLYDPGSQSCDASRGKFFVFGIADLESVTSGLSPQNPGFTCPSRNWNTAAPNTFEWVTGAYEN